VILTGKRAPGRTSADQYHMPANRPMAAIRNLSSSTVRLSVGVNAQGDGSFKRPCSSVPFEASHPPGHFTEKLVLADIPDIVAETSAHALTNEQGNILFRRTNPGTRWAKDIAG
jgi:hypothetical protein